MQVARRRLDLRPVLGLAALVAGAWWVTGLRPFSWSALLAVEGAGLAAVVVGLVATRRNGSPSSPASPVPAEPSAQMWPPGMGVWVALVAGLGGWELAAYLQHPRDEHPTLSLLLESVLAPQAVRAVAFAGWLVGTYHLARRR